ncbi:MAG: restriction endonuclease subunit S [Ruminococcus sp.]|nr:restriction endonuclease subunit S [Ruminococcus sp.]
MSWDTIRAEEYCESVRDGTHDTPKPVSNGYKLVTGKHIQNGQIDPTDAYFISENDYRKINERSKVEKWDVLMSMIGNGLGRSAVVKKEPDYAIKNIALFKVGDEKKAKWLHYYLSSPQGQGFIYNSLQGSGQPFISLSFIRDFPIPTPPLPYLNKAVSILEIYDDLIENNQKQIKLLEEAAQRLYKEWFVDLHFPGYENVKVVDGVPEGWRKGSAESFFNITIGKTPPRAEKQWFVDGTKGVPWLSISDMGSSGMYIFSTNEGLTEEAVKKHNMKVVPAGTVFVSFKLTVGRVAIANTDMCTNEAIAHFYVDNSNRAYTYCYLKNFEYDTLGNTSSISKAVNSKIIKAMPFIMPTNDVLESFTSIIEPILEGIKNKQSVCIYLAEARDRLLPKLMSGEVEV